MQTDVYLDLAGRSLRSKVLKPLARYGIVPNLWLSEAAFETAGFTALPRLRVSPRSRRAPNPGHPETRSLQNESVVRQFCCGTMRWHSGGPP